MAGAGAKGIAMLGPIQSQLLSPFLEPKGGRNGTKPERGFIGRQRDKGFLRPNLNPKGENSVSIRMEKEGWVRHPP